MSTVLRVGARTLDLGERPLLMGVVNASPDSFSDGGRYSTLDQRVKLARELLDDGADILDVGGESAATNRPAVEVEQEIERVVPLIERLTGEFGALVSVDTYKPPWRARRSPPAPASSTTSAACATLSSRACVRRAASRLS